MSDQPDCVNCKKPYEQHAWRHTYRGFCPGGKGDSMRHIYLRLYWPQDEDGKSAKSWDNHPPLSPIEQLLVNNIETIREVLDDWLATIDEMPIVATAAQEVIERAHLLRREIAELSGELDP